MDGFRVSENGWGVGLSLDCVRSQRLHAYRVRVRIRVRMGFGLEWGLG